MGVLRRSLLALMLVTTFASAEPPGGIPATVEEAAHDDAGPFLLGGEVFFWAPRRRGQDYAVLGSAPFGGPVGTLKTLEGSYDAGFRIAAGYRLASGVEVTGGYTHWHSAADEFLNATGGERLFPTLTHPAQVIEVNTARAGNNVNLNLFDVELARRFELGEGTRARAFFGPRFGNLDQSFTAVYEGGDVATDVVRRKLTFDGGGLRVGGDADFRLLEHIGLYVRGSAGLLVGRSRSTLEETANGVVVVNVVERFNKAMPTADLGVGLSYHRGGMRLSLGYEFQNWFGAFEGLDFVDDAQPAKVGRRTSDLGFDGIVVRAEWAF